MIRLQFQHLREIHAHFTSLAPQEACGLLAASKGISIHYFPIENDLHSPTAYQMNPRQQVEAMQHIERNGWDLAIIAHSHPSSSPHPSPEDIAAWHYPECGMLILGSAPRLSRWQPRLYTLLAGHIIPIPLHLVSNQG